MEEPSLSVMQADLERFYEKEVQAMPSSSTCPEPPTFDQFAYAYSMVSTRAFLLDNFHMVAMVPFCDMFNHSNRAHSSILTDSQVCEECGANGPCKHTEDEAEAVADRVASLSVSEKARDDIRNDVEMRVERKAKAGEEVLSCYEADVSDAKLLVEWGFVSGEGGGEGITWTPRIVLDQRTGRTFITMSQEGRLEHFDKYTIVRPSLADQPGLFNLYPDGKVSINLLVAVVLGCIPEVEDPATVEKVFTQVLHWYTEGKQGDVGAEKKAVEAVPRALVDLLQSRLTGIGVRMKQEADMREIIDVSVSRFQACDYQRISLILSIELSIRKCPKFGLRDRDLGKEESPDGHRFLEPASLISS